MKVTQQLAMLALFACASAQLLAQATPGGAPAKSTAAPQPWQYNLTIDGYVVPDGTSYASPVLTADHNWLHMEARYNYENLHTGSLWVGYNFNVGKTLSLSVTPMIGGIFGRTNGIAPGCEASLTYKKIEASISNEYIFDTGSKAGNFYYSWPQVTYSPLSWFRIGAVAQHTKAYQTPLNVQRGFLVGFSHRHWEFTTYVFNPELDAPTVVLEVGVSF
jgi:hypothetical protein